VNSGAPASALEPAGPTGRKRLRVKWIPGWEPPKGVEPQGAQTHSRSSDEAISRAALAPHGPACPLTCPHESVLAVTVIDITLLLWKEKGGSCGEAGCQAGAGAPMLPPAKGGAEQQEAGEGGWREHTHPPRHCSQTQVRAPGKDAQPSASLGRPQSRSQLPSISPTSRSGGCVGR